MRLFFVAVVVIVIFTNLANLHQSPVPQDQLDRGGEWLSWSAAERNTFVDGFIAGYSRGSHAACLSTNDLFERGKPHRLSDQPSARCFAQLETYSRYAHRGSSDFGPYTTVVTEFYSKHPEYRDIPFVYLLSLLSDRQYKTADQLYDMALGGELRTSF